MSEKITGIIEDKESKEGKTNDKDWKRFMFKVDGKILSSFNSNLDEFKVGDNVEVEYEMSGNYNNITSMKRAEIQSNTPPPTPVDNVPQTSAPEKQITQNYSIAEKETEASAASQTIIRAVAEMVSAGKIENGHIQISCLQLADNYKETKKHLLE